MSEAGTPIQYNPPLTVKAGQIQFIEACHPPLVAGEYQIGMTQLVKESRDAAVRWNSDPYASQLDFSVDAPRFTLDPAAIHSVYPPANEIGRFDNALPHVVFTRRTLPWERTLDGKPPEWGKPFPPWLAVLLLDENELNIRDDAGQETGARHEVKSLPVLNDSTDSFLVPRVAPGSQSVIRVPDLGQRGPTERWEMEKWRYEKASCLAIDLPATLFKAIAPRYRDLQYLAHVRQVDTGDKEVLGMNDKGWFSLAIGNRVPQADTSQRAFLVSLEGLQDCLKDDWAPGSHDMIRLAVLATWTFACAGSNDFKARMNALNLTAREMEESEDGTLLPDSWLRLPHDEYDNSVDAFPVDSGDIEQHAANVMNAAYARGFTAFNHIMRQGEKTVSWYRGPLVPLNYDKPPNVQEPVSTADKLLRYHPDIGMFDVTYAAAWQMGRLLALQNQSFALALYRARQVLRATAERAMRTSELAAQFTFAGSPEVFIEDKLMEQLVNGSGKNISQAIPT